VTDRLQRDVLQTSSAFWTQAVEQRGHCLLDLAEVKAIDSTGLAFLAHWQRRLAEARRNLILFRPSAVVCEALERMRLTNHFVITDGVSPGSFFSAGRRGKTMSNGEL
jgi:ABC-type transporter Mla MlaB component